jgi:hypothetical protein
MLSRIILGGFVVAGLAGAMIAGGDANAQSGHQIEKLSHCQRECAGNPACLRTCGGTVSKAKLKPKIPPPQSDPEPPTVKSWKDSVFGPSGNGGGGGGSGR